MPFNSTAMGEDNELTATTRFNIASYLPAAADARPDLPAVILSNGRFRGSRTSTNRITFRELEQLSNRYANGLVGVGLKRSMRTLVMVRPGIEFVGLIFALFKIGAVPVLIDPGMGVGRLLECVRHVRPEAFIGIALAHAVRVLRSASFPEVKLRIVVGKSWLWRGDSLQEMGRSGHDRFEVADTRSDETAAILFTSGSTGPAKGVVYQHGMFGAQVKLIQSQYLIQPGEIDLPTFPLFTLFNPTMGVTSVIPDMNPSQPARVDPKKLVSAIHKYHVSSSFGSPALWNRIVDYCVDQRIQLGSVRRVLMAGAPVPASLVERIKRILPAEAEVHTPYGATEALPVSSVSGNELIADCIPKSRQGAGNCVGRPLPGVEVVTIPVTDDAIAVWSDAMRLPANHCGEIVVKGSVVTQEYDGLPEANRLAKIRDADGWRHRMGDVGYFDEQGRLWFCGRKAHRVETKARVLWSIPCEAMFNNHPDVFRSALVGIGPVGVQQPVIVIEPRPKKFPNRSRREQFTAELLSLGAKAEHTRSIKHVLFHRSFPVDVRHNAKINREALAEWAAKRIR